MSRYNKQRDIYYENSEESELGVPVGVFIPCENEIDLEQFIMSLPQSEARVLIARSLGFEGRDAAELAGFESVWVYIRELKNLQRHLRIASMNGLFEV